ncbi:MAG: citrate synthase, partial [Bacteroidetes bacterium]|nr:citrate synthase [Bacteroidota bacterium]
HGGANTAVMNMLLEMQAKGDDLDPVEEVKGKLARKEKIMGFGHRVYKTLDPRAVHLQKMSKQLSEETGHMKLYEWSVAMLETMKSEKNIDANVDFFSATVYYSIGIQPDLYTCIFAMSRVSGWTAHFMEQSDNNRLIRPRALYIAEKNLDWTPIEQR